MKVLLISADTERINLPALPLGLALVGAAARAAGHDVAFLRIYPGTPLAQTAIRAGVITPEDDLLWPRFYLAPGLEQGLPEQPGEHGDTT